MGCIRGTGCHLPVLIPLPAGMIAFSRWIGYSTLSVSGKGGYMSRNSFQERRLVSRTIKVAFFPKVDEGRHSREDEGGSQRLSISGRTTGEPYEYRFASASLLFGLGGLKQGDRDSTDPPRFFGRRLRPVLFVPVLSKTRHDPLR